MYAVRFVLGLCGAFLLCGCASYRVKPLRKLTKETAQYVEKKDDIEVCALRLSEQEFAEYTNGMQFDKKELLVPVLIAIYNNTDHVVKAQLCDMVLTPLLVSDATTLLCARQHSLFTGAVYTGLGMFLGASIPLSVWASHATVGYAGGAMIGFVERVLAAGLITASVTALGFMVGGLVTARRNRLFKNALHADLCNKLLSRVEILPGEGISKLIIAPENQLMRPFCLSVSRSDLNEFVNFLIDVTHSNTVVA